MVYVRPSTSVSPVVGLRNANASVEETREEGLSFPLVQAAATTKICQATNRCISAEADLRKEATRAVQRIALKLRGANKD